MLVQLMYDKSKLSNEYRKVFVVIQIKLIQPPPPILLIIYHFVVVLKSPFCSCSGPKGQEGQLPSGLLGLGVWSHISNTLNSVLGGVGASVRCSPFGMGPLCLEVYWGSTFVSHQLTISVVGGYIYTSEHLTKTILIIVLL